MERGNPQPDEIPRSIFPRRATRIVRRACGVNLRLRQTRASAEQQLPRGDEQESAEGNAGWLVSRTVLPRGAQTIPSEKRSGLRRFFATARSRCFPRRILAARDAAPKRRLPALPFCGSCRGDHEAPERACRRRAETHAREW